MEKEQFTFFLKNYLSQWARTPFVIDKITYSHAEQWMMAEKARLFDDQVTLKEIMEADHPRDQKALGRLVKNFDQAKWDLNARPVVYKGNLAKFRQHHELKLKLLATRGTTLVEVNPRDKIWGIGLDENDSRIHDRATWQGLNWLGETLTQVREDIFTNGW